MAHLHNIYDSDIHFKLDSKTRTFSNETDLKLLVAQGDHNSERITFEIPRYIEQHDMLKCNRIEVHYINISSTTRDTSKDVYIVNDAQVSPEDENVVEFSWLLSGRATQYNGTLSFAISMKCLTDEVIDYRWNTLTYEKILVGKSLNNVETIAQEYSDVLEKWKKEVLENINPTVTIDTELNEESDNAIANCTVAKKISQLSDEKVDKQDGYSMVTNTEKEAWNGKSDFSGNYEDLTNKPTIPTKTSQLDNDSEFSTFSGSYNDLRDKPTIPSEYTLPIATPTTLGGVKPIAKTDEMTQEVGVDELGGLFTKDGGSSGESSTFELTTLEEGTVPTGTAQWSRTITSLTLGDLRNWKEFEFAVSTSQSLYVGLTTNDTATGKTHKLFYSTMSKSGGVCEWVDKDKRLLKIRYRTNESYDSYTYGSIFNSTESAAMTTFIATWIYTYVYLGDLSDECAISVYTHSELTDNLLYRIRGILK